ncbi:HemK family methyltransferase [Bacillus cereus BAG3X2-1]|nr:HemK family methyltransferase [Bacillus cereus BAG3X2-1]
MKMEKCIVSKLRGAGCVFAEDETRLLMSEALTPEDLMKMVEMRVNGLPLEYVVGYTEFCGLRIEVDRGVFVPRKRTEFLVHQTEALSRSSDIIVDLCCGSGAVGAALAAALGRVELYSVDIDPIAVQCASRNVTNFGGHAFEGDLYKALPDSLKGHVNILVANVPYVPTEIIRFLPREARLYEPNVTLDGGEDGLNILRRVAEEALLWLALDGHLLIETSEVQASQAFEIFAAAGLSTKVARNKELDATVIIGSNSSF